MFYIMMIIVWGFRREFAVCQCIYRNIPCTSCHQMCGLLLLKAKVACSRVFAVILSKGSKLTLGVFVDISLRLAMIRTIYIYTFR